MSQNRPPSLRDLRIAARDGDASAMRALLRRSRWPELAAEVRAGKPVPPRVHSRILSLTAGTGTPDTLNKWEWMDEHGNIVNDLLDVPHSDGVQT